MIKLVLLLLLIACGNDVDDRRATVSPTDAKIKDLQQQIDELSLLADSFTAGISNPFSDCETVVDAMEKKICQIAQTFNATQQLETKTQLGIMAKQFQNALYGDDCNNTSDAGCPVVGSIYEKLTTLKTTIDAHTASITTINATLATINTAVSTLQGKVTALEGRLNNFNGSGQTAETFVAAIKSDVTSLQSQIASIQNTITSDRILQTYMLCANITSSGPIYEAILITGDKSKAYGYVKTGTAEGLGMFFKAGDANKSYVTSINTRSCRYKMYNDPTNTKVQACWLSTNRSATEAQIDAARTAATATCTPY